MAVLRAGMPHPRSDPPGAVSLRAVIALRSGNRCAKWHMLRCGVGDDDLRCSMRLGPVNAAFDTLAPCAIFGGAALGATRHSITSSARARRLVGRSSPRLRAAPPFSTSSKRIGRSMGRRCGGVPRRISAAIPAMRRQAVFRSGP